MSQLDSQNVYPNTAFQFHENKGTVILVTNHKSQMTHTPVRWHVWFSLGCIWLVIFDFWFVTVYYPLFTEQVFCMQNILFTLRINTLGFTHWSFVNSCNKRIVQVVDLTIYPASAKNSCNQLSRGRKQKKVELAPLAWKKLAPVDKGRQNVSHNRSNKK